MQMLSDAAELVISELVTNAVRASTDERGHPRYANGRMPVIQVRMLADGVRLLLEVWDMAPALPVVRQAAAADEAGRGLQLVDTLTSRWHWQTVPGWPGKCVWAELHPLLS
jgi:anti-sigma regulatory factor (Ser/Thr protein kinase)